MGVVAEPSGRDVVRQRGGEPHGRTGVSDGRLYRRADDSRFTGWTVFSTAQKAKEVTFDNNGSVTCPLPSDASRVFQAARWPPSASPSTIPPAVNRLGLLIRDERAYPASGD
jgi:hypothetical protein